MALIILVPGCEKYRAKPLATHQILVDVERTRRLLATIESDPSSVTSSDSQKTPKPDFTFARAADLMRTHSPSLKEAKAEYETVRASATIKTPFPNPSVEAGPQFGFGPDLSSASPYTPFGSLGFTIPTGKRLKRQDELNRAHADLARMESAIKYRELYLELRRQFSRLALAHSRISAKRKIADSARESTTLTKRLIEVGTATALDVGLIELEQARLQMDMYSAETTLADVAADLSKLIGVHTDHFVPMPESALAWLPDSVPSLKQLQQMLTQNHPGLARLRARYEVSERELRLEVAKQYPDFTIGPHFSREVGERKNVLGLTLGIELPIFDRNQQAVATAKKRRDEIQVKYEAEANRALAGLDRAWRGYELASGKLKLLKTSVLPKASANIELARKSIEAGATDSLRFLETERSQRAVLLDALETELAVRESWVELELAVGYPLMLLPGETSLFVPAPLEPQTAPATLHLEADVKRSFPHE